MLAVYSLCDSCDLKHRITVAMLFHHHVQKSCDGSDVGGVAMRGDVAESLDCLVCKVVARLAKHGQIFVIVFPKLFARCVVSMVNRNRNITALARAAKIALRSAKFFCAIYPSFVLVAR